MDSIDLKNRLKEIIIEVTHSSDDVEDIEDTDFLIDDLGVDSMGMINLVQNLQRHFGIEIPDSDVMLSNFKSIELLGKYIASKLDGE